MHILIAEDDPVTRMHLAAALKGLGYDVTATNDGTQAWGNLRMGNFAVVISDWEMPGMDGAELCRQLRAAADAHYTYFILVTSSAGKPRYLEGMKAGADDFIAKPVDIEELHARLQVAERILGLRRHVKQLEGLLPICSYCKRIRDERETWNALEQFIEKRSAAQFTHSICPDCYKQHVEPQLRR